MTHGLGWQDEGMAQVVRCGKVVLKDDLVILCDSHEPPRECPVCGAWLRLRWVVEAVEVPQPSGAT